MSNEKVVCSSCGASFDKDEPKCPYCGSLNPYGAEKEYNEKLENIRGKLDVVDDIARESYIGPLKKGIKAFLIVFCINAAIFALGVGVAISNGRGNLKKRREDLDKKIERILIFKDNTEELDKLYEEKKYDKIALRFDEMERAERSEIGNWEHYHFINAYQELLYSREYALKYNELDEKYYYNLSNAIYHAESFYVMSFMGYFSEFFTEDEKAELTAIWEEYVPDLLEKIDIPEEDFNKLLESAIKNERAQYEECSDYAKERLGVE